MLKNQKEKPHEKHRDLKNKTWNHLIYHIVTKSYTYMSNEVNENRQLYLQASTVKIRKVSTRMTVKDCFFAQRIYSCDEFFFVAIWKRKPDVNMPVSRRKHPWYLANSKSLTPRTTRDNLVNLAGVQYCKSAFLSTRVLLADCSGLIFNPTCNVLVKRDYEHTH